MSRGTRGPSRGTDRDDALEAALDQVARPLRGLSGLTRLLAGIALALALLAIAAWLARIGAMTAPLWVLALWALAPLSLVAGLVAARRAIRRLGPWHVGEALERFGAWRQGALTTVLDAPAPGTSASLHAAAVSHRAAEVLDRAPEALAGVVGRERGLSRRAALAALVALLLLFAARPTTGAAMALWDPVGAWNALTAPVRLSARAASVAHGESAVLDVTAIGRRHATLFTRAPGEAWRVTEIALDAAGRAVVTTPPLAAELVARVEAGGRRSPEVYVGIRLAAFLGAFTVTAHYPAYLDLEAEALPTGGDTLVLPEGTRLAVSGRATTALGLVALDGPAGRESLSVAGLAFHGDVTPRTSGLWRLIAVPAAGGALRGELPTFAVRLVPDSAPVVEIPIPGVDTVASPSMSLAVVVSARDDHGLTAVAIETRRNGSRTIARIPVALPPGGSDRALITMALDLSALGVVAGDTLHYAAVALDNAPVHHAGRSHEYAVRIPTEDEQRAAREQATGATATALDSLRNAAGRVQRDAEDLARERQRGDTKSGQVPSPGEAPKTPVSLDVARKAETTAAEQQKVLDDAAKLQQKVDELRQAAERAGLADTALARQLNEISQLLDKALSPELKARLDSLRGALKNLDADQMKTALQDLAKDEAQLKQALDQAHELFKRAALETDLANIAEEAKELAAKQDTLTKKLAQSDSGKSAASERDLARRADSLGATLERAAAKVPADTTKQQLRDAAAQAHDAAAQMQQAGQAAQQNQPSQAQTDAKKAEENLAPLSGKISQARQQMQRQMRDEVLQALNRALQETSRLAQQQLAVADAFDRAALVSDTRAQQGLVEEGAAKIMQQVVAAATMNALVSPQAGIALAAARQSMRNAVDAVSAANPNLREASAQAGDAVDALAVAAFSLLQSKDKVNGSQSGSGMQEAIAQMQQMAGKEGQLSQQSSGMMQQGQVGLQQMLQLAAQQRAIAQQMERLRATGQLPGAGEMAREAKELAQTLGAGQLTPETVDRQQKLFKRMLDAGRTLQGDEQDDSKRQSTTAKDGVVHVPPALDPRLESGAGDIRLPSWESLQRLSPEERRWVIDYFRRLAGGEQ